MAVNGVDIKVGQVWKARGGANLKVSSRRPGTHFCWSVTREDGALISTVNEQGRQFVGDADGECDLLFLVSDPDVQVERRKQQTENAPLRRKDDFPPVPETLPDLAAEPAEFAASIPGALGEPVVVPADSPRQGMSAPASSENVFDRLGDVLRREFSEVSSAIERHAAAEAAKHSALDVQIGGNHYKQFAIQPVEFIHRNGIGFIEGNAIKYLCRWRDKGGVQDLKKVKHYIDLLIEMEEKK